MLGLISISLTGCLSMLFPETNNPPVITLILDAAITLGEIYTYTVTVSEKGDRLLFKKKPVPPFFNLNNLSFKQYGGKMKIFYRKRRIFNKLCSI